MKILQSNIFELASDPKGGAPLPEDQVRNTFKKFDTDNDNQLSFKELTKAFQFLGSRIPVYRADRILLHADANNDRFVSEEEMNKLVKYAAGHGFTDSA
ncbi:hypothetical protein ACB092_01G031700 [Castanea dentata]